MGSGAQIQLNPLSMTLFAVNIATVLLLPYSITKKSVFHAHNSDR